jgi:hypothetical protein
MKFKVCLIMLGLMLVLFSYSLAQVPQMINYQGKLTKSSGAVLDTTVQMIFSIYADSNGTVLKWTETQGAVVVDKGIFNVLLGSVNPIPDTAFNGSIRYLGVTVGADPEITPRKPMVSVPYAMRAGTAGAGANSGWVDDGTNVRLEDSTNFVSIGTSYNNYQKLFLSAVGFQMAIQEKDGAFDEKNWSIRADNGGFNLGTVTDDFGGWATVMFVDRTGASPDRVVFPNPGKFGIWDAFPNALLEVSSDGGATDLFMVSSSTSGNGDRFIVKNNGFIGIGTTSPAYKLDVNGDINVAGSYNVKKGGVNYNHPDYVFEPDYKMMPLEELRKYVAEKKALPGVITAEEVKKNEGFKMDELLVQMLEKLEEQTLYIFQLEERIAELEKKAQEK